MTAPTTRADGIDFAASFISAITDDWPCDVDAVEPHAEIRVLASPGEIAESVLTHCAHPNAPTIGQMLREWQALTALAEYAGHQHGCFMGTYAYVGSARFAVERPCTCGLDAARAALEAVRCSEDT